MADRNSTPTPCETWVDDTSELLGLLTEHVEELRARLLRLQRAMEQEQRLKPLEARESRALGRRAA